MVLFKKRKIFFLAGFLLILIGLCIWGSRDFEVKNSHQNKTPELDWAQRSSLSGEKCEDYNRRPLAVMLSGVSRVRPLSGLQAADMVFEMPVTVGGINRLMAVYICGNPSEIGSLRSARHDFISLARGLDSIYAHWGGSHFALEKLQKGIMDNIDALPNRYKAFYRKSGYQPPDNGFTTTERLLRSAKSYGYRLETEFEGYPHSTLEQIENKEATSTRILEVRYPGNYKVSWEYNPDDNYFYRLRGGTPEIDELTGGQVKAKNIVIMRAQQRHLEGQYNDVDVEGEGEAAFYRAGREIAGSWQKPENPPESKLTFLTEDGDEFKFLPGQIWVEVIGPDRQVLWR